MHTRGFAHCNDASSSPSKNSFCASEVLGSFKGAIESSRSLDGSASEEESLHSRSSRDVVMSQNVIETSSDSTQEKVGMAPPGNFWGFVPPSSEECSQDLVCSEEISSNGIRAAWSHPPSVTSSAATIVPQTRLVPAGVSHAPSPRAPDRNYGYSPAPSVGSVRSRGSGRGRAGCKGSRSSKIINTCPKDRGLHCANVNCNFLLHTDSDITWAFCCGKCEGRHFGQSWALSGEPHGKKCEARTPPSDGPATQRALAMRTPNVEAEGPSLAPSIASSRHSNAGECSIGFSDGTANEFQAPPPPPAPLLVGSEVRLIALSDDIRHLEGHKASIMKCCERCNPLFHVRFPLDGGEVCGIREEQLEPTRSPYLVSRHVENCQKLCTYCVLCNTWAGTAHLNSKRHITRAYAPWKFILEQDIPRQGRLKPLNMEKGIQGRKAYHRSAPPPPLGGIQEEEDEDASWRHDDDSDRSDGGSEGGDLARQAPPAAAAIGGWSVPPAPSETPDAFQNKYAWTGRAQATNAKQATQPPAGSKALHDFAPPPPPLPCKAASRGSASTAPPPPLPDLTRSETSTGSSVAPSLREFLRVESTESPPPLPPRNLAAGQLGHANGNQAIPPCPQFLPGSHGIPPPPQSLRPGPMPPPPDRVFEAPSQSLGSSGSSTGESIYFSGIAGSIAGSVISGASFTVAASDVLTGSAPQADVPVSDRPSANSSVSGFETNRPRNAFENHKKYARENHRSATGSDGFPHDFKEDASSVAASDDWNRNDYASSMAESDGWNHTDYSKYAWKNYGSGEGTDESCNLQLSTPSANVDSGKEVQDDTLKKKKSNKIGR